MSFEKQHKELADLCKKLLEDGTVNAVVGFQEGGVEGMSLPFILTDSADAGKLAWNNRCVPNLGQYLMGRQGKTAITAKACDARAVVSLIRENQLKRDDVYIIGLACNGMVDAKGNPLNSCRECHVDIPPVHDILIDYPGFEMAPKAAAKSEQLPLDKSLERFVDEMEKCILCYSCRQGCYGCYCNTCFMDRGEPNWQPTKPDIGAKMLYHLGRAMHLSGRCVECGACENNCASGVDIRYLIREATSFVDELYDYKAGMDLETESAMLSYTTGDREVGFLGGECDA